MAHFYHFVIKVASRCNLACDYCFMYEHEDQSWRSMPSIMSREDFEQTLNRIAEYTKIEFVEGDRFRFILHGGEPLLVGEKKLLWMVERAREILGDNVDLGMQTNGTLLTSSMLESLEKYSFGIGLSLDGPKSHNDTHRLTHDKKSSFESTENALKLLTQYQHFGGILAVIDPYNSPRELLDYFHKMGVVDVDLCVPYASHDVPHLGLIQPGLFSDWLKDCFDYWFENYQDMKIRWFESTLGMMIGSPSQVDTSGEYEQFLLTIDTDGSYRNDYLRIVEDGASFLGSDIWKASISELADSEKLRELDGVINGESLCDTCLNCRNRDVCGGFWWTSRLKEGDLDNVSVYCDELMSFFDHIKETHSNPLIALQNLAK